jgi:hypothetical protein
VFVTIDAILVACILHDLRSSQRIHAVTIVSGLALLAFQVLRFPVPAMDWWRATYDVVLGLVM